jgi:protein-tyrosine phosphatase
MGVEGVFPPTHFVFYSMKIKVIFICLGNICRSPMAEAVFQNMADDAGLQGIIEVDSAGTGSWHVGESAHPGTRRVLAQHGIDYMGRARVVRQEDVVDPSSYVIAVDASTLHELQRRFGEIPNLYLLLDFAKNSSERDVPDPYYEGNFEYVYKLVEDASRGLLAAVIEREGLN